MALIASRKYHEKYVGFRERGYNEWTVKSMAEVDPEYIKALDAAEQIQQVAGFLENLVKVVRARQSILEHISHNQRAEVRADRVS
jgi:hypothetical protein